MLEAGYEQRILDMLYEDYQGIEALLHGLRGAPGWTQVSMMHALQAMLRRGWIKPYRFEPKSAAYIELSAGDGVDPLSISFFATDLGREEYDKSGWG